MKISKKKLSSLIMTYLTEDESKCDAKAIEDKVRTIKKNHGLDTGWKFSKHPLDKSSSDVKAGMNPKRDFTGASRHGGIDYWWKGIEGSPIYSIADGKIVKVWGTSRKPDKYNGWGVDIVHDQEDCIYHSSQYIHMKKPPGVIKDDKEEHGTILTVGTSVTRGQPIGIVGNTGASQGAHLHFQVKQGRGAPGAPSAGVHVDPGKFFGKAGEWKGGAINPEMKAQGWSGGQTSTTTGPEISEVISRSQLRSMIKNQILLEYTEYFGSEFSEFKRRFDAGEDPEAVAKDILSLIGTGSTRVVYGFEDNASVVLKIINTDIEAGKEDKDIDIHGFVTANKLASNQWEADLQMQQIYPDIFPRTFEVAPDYSWILAERVDPISKVELLSHVNLGDERFPGGFIGRLQFETVVTLAVDYFKKSPESDFVKNVLNEGTVVEPLADPTAVDPDYDDSLPTNFPLSSFDETMALSKDERPGQNTRPVSSTLKRRLEKILSVPHVRRIFSAMAELDIPAREFSAKNLGISRISGKLTILDASLWKEHKKLR